MSDGEEIEHEQIRIRTYENHPWHVTPDESYNEEHRWAKVLLAVVAAIVWLAILLILPGLAILLAIIAMPFIFVYTVASHRSKGTKRATNAGRDQMAATRPGNRESASADGVGGFLGSLAAGIGVVMLVGLCAVIAFFVVCLATFRIR